MRRERGMRECECEGEQRSDYPSHVACLCGTSVGCSRAGRPIDCQAWLGEFVVDSTSSSNIATSGKRERLPK